MSKIDQLNDVIDAVNQYRYGTTLSAALNATLTEPHAGQGECAKTDAFRFLICLAMASDLGPDDAIPVPFDDVAELHQPGELAVALADLLLDLPNYLPEAAKVAYVEKGLSNFSNALQKIVETPQTSIGL